MRTRAVLTSIFASVGVLVVGWQAGAATATRTISLAQASSSTATIPAPTSPTTPNGTTSTTTPSATPSAAPVAGPVDGTYVGATVGTPFGTVRVQVTIAKGAITDVTALKLTDDGGRSVQISNQAAPILRQEVLAAQSANVSNVSGATFTTQGYLSSLQSALDQAHF